MTYKYKKIVTQGANGTSLMHKSTEENPIFTLGEIDGFIYIKANALLEQHQELQFIEIVLTGAEKDILLTQRPMQVAKESARLNIRKIKDFEDDLTDQKMLIQFLARGLVSIYGVLNEEQKNLLPEPYKSNFSTFSSVIFNNDVRLDKELNPESRVMEIMMDEVEFANIVEKEYKGVLK